MNNDDNTYNAFCTTIIREDTIDYEAYRKICSSFAKSIGYVYSEGYADYSEDNINEVCAYLNYWLNNELRKIETPSKNALEFYKKLKTSGSHNPLNMDICETRITNMDDTVFTNVEFLHNLFFNLHEYRNNFRKGDSVICAYAKKFSILYNKRKNECRTENSSPFCKKLTKFRETYDETMSTTKCNRVPKNIQSFDDKTIADILTQMGEDGTSMSVARDMQDAATPGSNFPNSLSSRFTLPVTIIFGIVSIFILFCKVKKIFNTKI
ncbi:hypothetical protein PVMG_06155 [Plasmodium vivax Mauritania I]|uniref:Variable surface protein Vir7-like protein n=1 Tax=Plasmodium vivax Mauritania I TaxID=1035515 RepID=A0A0J9TKH5_PLAVI|nr:hypothetical protein PVMG_06155 [Plasmodium vivax Mauritania I]